MPTYEYQCLTCDDAQERVCKVDERMNQQCVACGNTLAKRIRTPPKPNWLALAMGDSASPEAINKFDKMHRDKAAKEQKQMDEHGSYAGSYTSQ